MQSSNRIHDVMDELSMRNPFAGKDVSPVERIREVCCSRRAAVPLQLAAIQRTIASLEYNHLPTTFFNLQKARPLQRIMATAKEIVAESLPIRCLEATFLAVLLTQHLDDVDRIPLAFKSWCDGSHYRHIVLVVAYQGTFGALGLSRRGDLMDKPLTFPSIALLIEEYAQSYRRNSHRLVSFKLGLPISHQSMSRRVPMWRFVSLAVSPEFSSTLHDTNLHAVLVRYGEAYKSLGDEYDAQLVAPGPIAPDSPATAGNAAAGTEDDDDAEASGSEENRHRVGCLLAAQSPFRNAMRSGVAGARLVYGVGGGPKREGLATRLRGAARMASRDDSAALLAVQRRGRTDAPLAEPRRVAAKSGAPRPRPNPADL